MTPLPEVLCSQANIQLPTRDQGQAGWHASQGVRTGTFTCVGANKSQEDISIFIYTWNPPMGVGMSIFQHLKLPWECFELSFSFELDLRLFTVIVLELTNSKLAAGLPASSLIKVQCISFQIYREPWKDLKCLRTQCSPQVCTYFHNALLTNTIF